MITQNLNIPLIVQPQLFSFLSLLSWGQVRAIHSCILSNYTRLTRDSRRQCMYYGKKRSFTVSMSLLLGSMAILGGFEAGMVFAIKVPHSLDLPSANLKRRRILNVTPCSPPSIAATRGRSSSSAYSALYYSLRVCCQSPAPLPWGLIINETLISRQAAICRNMAIRRGQGHLVDFHDCRSPGWRILGSVPGLQARL